MKDTVARAFTRDDEIFQNSKGIRFRVKSFDEKTLTVVGLSDNAEAKLKALSIPASVNWKGYKYSVIGIEDGAFENNQTLTKVTIPKTVKDIGENAFLNALNIKTVSLGNGVESIGYRAFSGCTAVKSVTIPVAVKTIGEKAFSGCTQLQTVTIQSGALGEIGAKAFDNISADAVFKIKVKARADEYRKLLTGAGVADTQIK